MGNRKKVMEKLSNGNVLVDYGTIDIKQIIMLEENFSVIFPKKYTEFIIIHNGASLIIDSFNFYDNDLEQQNNASIAFIPIEKITKFMEGLLNESKDDPGYFSQKLIPFGDDGGGNYMCFDYREHKGNNPPIIYWNHSVYENSKRISFIANSFEEFINMLHKYED